MKRNVVIILMLLASFASVQSFAKNGKHVWQDKVAAMTEEQKEARVAEMKERVEEIKSMDKSKLTSEDRKALRHELRDMNKEAKALGSGGIYISLAGIIIIILLLIIIL